MAYRQNSQRQNPYNENQYGSPPQQQQQHHNEFNEGYGGHPNAQYNDSYDTYGDYNAYNNQHPHQTYEQGGYNQYTGVTGYPDDADRGTPSPESVPPVPPSKETYGNTTAYEHDDQVTQVRPRGKLPSSCVVPRVRPHRPIVDAWHRQKSFKGWRAEGQENLWTRGSRTRTCGRFFCCTVMITVFLIISILLSLALVSWRSSTPPPITVI